MVGEFPAPDGVRWRAVIRHSTGAPEPLAACRRRVAAVWPGADIRVVPDAAAQAATAAEPGAEALCLLDDSHILPSRVPVPAGFVAGGVALRLPAFWFGGDSGLPALPVAGPLLCPADLWRRGAGRGAPVPEAVLPGVLVPALLVSEDGGGPRGIGRLFPIVRPRFPVSPSHHRRGLYAFIQAHAESVFHEELRHAVAVTPLTLAGHVFLVSLILSRCPLRRNRASLSALLDGFAGRVAHARLDTGEREMLVSLAMAGEDAAFLGRVEALVMRPLRSGLPGGPLFGGWSDVWDPAGGPAVLNPAGKPAVGGWLFALWLRLWHRELFGVVAPDGRLRTAAAVLRAARLPPLSGNGAAES